MGDFFFSLGRYTLASIALGIAISTWAQVVESISMNTLGIILICKHRLWIQTCP